MCRDLCTPAPSMSNETWFSAGIFPRLESTECRDFRHKCAHTSWLPRGRSWPASDLQKWEISGKMRDESWRPLGKMPAVRPSATEPKSLKTPKNNARNHRYSVLLHWSTCVGKFEGHLFYLGEISEQRSLIRETDRDQPPWLIWKRTQRVGCLCSHRDAPSTSRRISGKLTEENRGATGTCLNFLESICTNRHRIFGFLRVLAFILRWSKMIDRDFCMSTK